MKGKNQKLKVERYTLNFTEHAKERMEERGISRHNVMYSLKSRIKTLRYMKTVDKTVCYNSNGVSVLFDVSGWYINVITVLNKSVEHIKNAIVIQEG